MGFLSKLMKNPLVQTALPFALSYAMGSPWAMKLGQSKMFSGMSPLMANALKQSALGYGTAALSGSKRPWKGAMYAGLTSIPFSYMSAAKSANAFNEQLGDIKGWESEIVKPAMTGTGGPISPHLDTPINFRQFEIPAKMGLSRADSVAGLPKKLSAWDIMTGRTPDKFTYQVPVATDKLDPKRLAYYGDELGDSDYYKLVDETLTPGGADIFTKQTPLALDATTGTITGGEAKSDWLPTAVAQAAALYGGRDTPEEEWEAARKKRKKELAWMYGVDEDMIEGEMDNPWYGGGGYWNKGGIASLDMSYGGDVNGPGTGTSDSIDAKLSDGEFVMTAKAVENFGGGDRYEGARKMYQMMNMLDPQSESMSEVV